MKNASQYIRSALIAMFLGLSGETAMAQVVVVVSTASPLSALSEQQIADIFLGRAAYFPGGGTVIPIDLPEDATARNEFYRRVTGKTTSQMKAYWSKLIFTGRGQPPREVQDSAAIKRALAETPNAIGYMDSRDIDASVKPLLTLN